jgi:hypothetical protein
VSFTCPPESILDSAARRRLNHLLSPHVPLPLGGLAVDKRHGFFVNHDLAGYEVPVHADIPHQEVVFLDEIDPLSSPMKAKGVGELGICGVSAAVAQRDP